MAHRYAALGFNNSGVEVLREKNATGVQLERKGSAAKAQFILLFPAHETPDLDRVIGCIVRTDYGWAGRVAMAEVLGNVHPFLEAAR